jgi:hypothetical protein
VLCRLVSTTAISSAIPISSAAITVATIGVPSIVMAVKTDISVNAKWIAAIAAGRTSGSGSIAAVRHDDCKGYEYHKQEFHFYLFTSLGGHAEIPVDFVT